MKLRLPEQMREQIAKAAEKHGRSLNSEILSRLEETFSGASNPNMVAAIARLSVKLALANTDKITDQMRLALLATHIRRLAQLLAPFLDSLGDEEATEIHGAIKAANEHMHSIPALKQQAADQSVSMRKALEHMHLLGGAGKLGTELDQVLDELSKAAGSVESSAETKDPSSSAPEAPQPISASEPPKRPARIRRPVGSK